MKAKSGHRFKTEREHVELRSRRLNGATLDARQPFLASLCAFVSSRSWTFCYARPTAALTHVPSDLQPRTHSSRPD